MRTKTLTALALAALAPFAFADHHEDDGFTPIFDGKSLDNWDGDPKFWRVEDGAIVGESTPEKKVEYNTFLTWMGGELDDFELKLQYKITNGNSGIQTRSFRLDDKDGTQKWRIGGYQSDFEAGDRYSGIVYGEGFRGILADRGQKTKINEDGKPEVIEKFGDSGELGKSVKKGEWNDFHITFKGYHLQNRINGQLMADMTDEDTDTRLRTGLLALQMHVGPAMKVEFKNIRLKRHKLEDKKKVVFFPGGPSHGRGSHEHRAGCLLLAKALNDNFGDKVHATVYTKGGWPDDRTALQNADALIIYCDGGGRHMANKRLKTLDPFMDKGVGLGCIHYGVEVPKGASGDAFLEWIGGYFEAHWSVNPHWTAQFKEFPKHPVANGVKPFDIKDEWYYHMRFRPDMKGVTPILSAIPPKETLNRPDGAHSGNPHVRATVGQPQHVCWVSEREGGNRGFGFTGGHFHKNWKDDNFRKTVLNAIYWIAGGEVPEEGVPSKSLTDEEVEANQD